MTQLQGLAPVMDARTRLVVLGSFPGVVSLQAQQYYGHPQNAFWKILGALWQQPLVDMPYPERLEVMLSHGLGLWDVCRACVREGSLDANMREEVPNDLSLVLKTCPNLVAIAHNGAKSYGYKRHTEALGLPVHPLPSTSPANASWSFARKRDAWAQVLALYGICHTPG